MIDAEEDPDLLDLSSPLLLPDGRVVLFNGGSCEIRFYDANATLLRSAGRCGEGPGEFDRHARIWRWRGDSLLVVDQLNRISVLDADGAYARVLRLPVTTGMPLPLVRGVLDDGTIVLVSLRDPAGRTSPGIEVGRLEIAVLPADGELMPLGSFAGPSFEYTEHDGRLGRGVLAFSGSTQIAAGGEDVYVGFPHTYEIQQYGTDGTLDLILRRSHDPVAVEARDIEWLLERRLDQIEGEENRRIVRQAYRDLRHAPEMPAFGVPAWPGGSEGGPPMLVDDVGNLWVFEHYRPGEYGNRWSVFAADGRWLGRIELPPHFSPSQIGRDFVIGVGVGGSGFSRVQLFRMVRPA